MKSLKRTLTTLVLSSTILFNNTCHIIEKAQDEKELELRKQGYNPIHIERCGTIALHQLLKKYHIYIPKKELSKEITDNNTLGNIIRFTAGLFNKEGEGLTLPYEIHSTLEAHLDKTKYQIITRSNSPEEMRNYLIELIKKDEKGIVLLKDENSLFGYHWEYFHLSLEPLDCYGKKTQVKKIYLIKEKSYHSLP